MFDWLWVVMRAMGNLLLRGAGAKEPANAIFKDDYDALTTSMRERMDRSEQRQELLQRQVDTLTAEMMKLRWENAQLKEQLAASEARHQRDAQTIAGLTERIKTLEQKQP